MNKRNENCVTNEIDKASKAALNKIVEQLKDGVVENQTEENSQQLPQKENSNNQGSQR